MDAFHSGVHDVVALPTTDSVAVAGSRSALVWQVWGGRAVGVPLSPDGTLELKLTHDGEPLVGCGMRGVYVWRPPWNQAPKVIPHNAPLFHIAVSRAGGGCVAGVEAKDGRIRLWRLPSGTPLTTMTGHTDAVQCLAATPDGELLASGSRDGTIRLWRLPSGKPAGVLDHTVNGVQALLLFMTGAYEAYAELDSDGSMLAAAHAAADDALRSRLARRARESARTEWVQAIVGRRGRDRPPSMSNDEWDAAVETLTANEQWPRLWHLAHEAPPPWAALMLRILTDQGWAPESREERAGFARLTRLAEDCHGEPDRGFADAPQVLGKDHGVINKLLLTPDGRSLISAGNGRGVQVRDLSSGAKGRTLSTGDWFGLALFPDGDRLAATAGGRVRLWRLSSGSDVPVTTLVDRNLVTNQTELITTQDGAIVIVGGMHLRVLRTPWAVRPFPLEVMPHRGASIEVNGHVVIGGNGALLVFDLKTNKVIVTRRAFEGTIDRVVATPDGYGGAEIEQAIVDAMYVGFNQDREFRTGDILAALDRQVPLSVSQRETIAALRAWLREGRAQSASFAEAAEAEQRFVVPLEPLDPRDA